MLSMLGKKKTLTDDNLKYFSRKIGFTFHACKLSPEETICVNVKSIFWENKKNITNLLSAEFAQRMVKPFSRDYRYLTNLG